MKILTKKSWDFNLILSYFGIFVPKLSPYELLTIIGLGVAALFINDFVKVAVFKKLKMD